MISRDLRHALVYLQITGRQPTRISDELSKQVDAMISPKPGDPLNYIVKPEHQHLLEDHPMFLSHKRVIEEGFCVDPLEVEITEGGSQARYNHENGRAIIVYRAGGIYDD